MSRPDVSIIIVSYNTRDFTLGCLRSLYAETREVSFEVIVVDNDSSDGSAKAIAREFPQATLECSKENLGFGGACNYAAELAVGEYLLMLNPDTLVLDGAVQKLVRFAASHPDARLYGGRTLWGDRTLNPTSCWRRPTPWSMFCRSIGLAAAFRHHPLFDSESYGHWQRDDVREIDIVTGCLMLIHRDLWRDLGGFDRAFFQRGEDTDFSLRARSAGYRALHCPDSTIVHYGGRAETVLADKVCRNMLAKQAIIDRHWSPLGARAGLLMQRVWVLRRFLGWRMASLLGRAGAAEKADIFEEVWARRAEWKGLPADAEVAGG
jgi:N-acetylglucosaminyl-diphospho-decaprenol L-rhamnosyltransferase